MENVKTRDPIPECETLEEIAGFGDTHSTAGYDDLTHEVHVDINNVWLTEKG
ncbi:hypothetical protein U27_03584 [Candidatus Vecturithrix granuli]|uniref:Uncharacterized protein n=1 Tax=Vecturithrix granuli TaxID=1499967 RepID=A0A081BWB6_VECG1|nr:hypothetical protein U27_03584 [Candidatus Vecturithrix granuli]